MKIRSNYVSNSSSSSYIVDKDLSDKGIACLKLTKAQKELLNGSKIYDETIVIPDTDKDIYLTEFICECENKYEYIQKCNHIFYQEGELNGTPRDEDYYNEYTMDYGRSVYILKEHDVAKQMSFNKFVTEYKRSDLPKEVIVEIKNNFELLD